MPASLIREQLKNIRKTKKITYAMELVAMSKLRKAQACVLAGRAYANIMQNIVNDLPLQDYQHPLCQQRPPQTIGLVLFATDRGLCGSLNTQLIRSVMNMMAQHTSVTAYLLGKKTARIVPYVTVAHASMFHDQALSQVLTQLAATLQTTFEKKEVDVVYCAYQQFVSVLSQRPMIEKILPIMPSSVATTCEPHSGSVINPILQRYIRGCLKQAWLEHHASEQAARRMAMHQATDNAQSFLEELQRIDNQTRQAGITREILDIISGSNLC
jgi:F-type H+-transporting ATPase subunit gamma